MCRASATQFKLMGQRLNQSQGLRPSKKTGITTRIMRCSNCNLIFSNPLPVPANVQDHYGVPPEQYWKEEYFTMEENYFSGEIQWLRKLKKIEPGMKSLDIGAGLGKQMIALNNQGFDAHGFEASPQFYERAITKMGIDTSKIKLSTIEQVNYANETFDFISFGAVLEHLYDPSEAIAKAMKWLKPDGVIHIEVPSAHWLMNRIINGIYRMTGSRYVGNISPMHPPYHLYEFSLDSFKRNSELNNYKVVDFGYYVCSTTFPRIFDGILKPYMKMTNTGMQLCVWLGK